MQLSGLLTAKVAAHAAVSHFLRGQCSFCDLRGSCCTERLCKQVWKCHLALSLRKESQNSDACVREKTAGATGRDSQTELEDIKRQLKSLLLILKILKESSNAFKWPDFSPDCRSLTELICTACLSESRSAHLSPGCPEARFLLRL